MQPPPLTPGGTLLAKQMKAYWANFVKTTTPNRFAGAVAALLGPSQLDRSAYPDTALGLSARCQELFGRA